MLAIQGMVVQRGQGTQAHKIRLPKLCLSPGECLAITGPSGCGKSTLLEAVGLLLAPSALEHFILGKAQHDVATLWRNHEQGELAKLRARDIGFVLQNGGLLPFLNVADNIALPRRLQGLPNKSDRVEQAVERLGLTLLMDKRPAMLSIGERQRVAFVRALAHEPHLLLADEPTAALDPHSAHGLFALFMEVVEELQLAALVVSHDWDLVQTFGLARFDAITLKGETVFEPRN
ncbi:ABC transporter ATP-binding protein [Halomonas sp. GFAJ-1]|uniref:ABC transporter ATP-binding protein n=1 Tax=Halomonas sp. GFAJ-1 TaxID=1118153 RepID=UPI00023A386E|nr:ABC transporter ATP-binding protein [Halomonas sp. GFAJ-1]AVI62994.1 ABC transporter ATP-binding protein [Halomonas sp. GFAJ-1]EHK60302.1 ABC transporter ATP-binding protein [Halomonas sp. GFAJ-1]